MLVYHTGLGLSVVGVAKQGYVTSMWQEHAQTRTDSHCVAGAPIACHRRSTSPSTPRLSFLDILDFRDLC